MKLFRIAAFSEQDKGGNPAGVAICETLPSGEQMQHIAAEIGYAETVFAAPQSDTWRVRYFAPTMEIPFCGHATIALGAVLARSQGNAVFKLQLNHSAITVEGKSDILGLSAALQSPPTQSQRLSAATLSQVMNLFGFSDDDLDYKIPPAYVNAGSGHFVLALNDRSKLASMSYNLEEGRELMSASEIATIALIYKKDKHNFDARNAFAVGGMIEDPATGAAAAAVGGYLRDLNWPLEGTIKIIQGEDMGMRSVIYADIPNLKGSSIRISGAARVITE
jgi:PhzF family phenazine biosynthesis protein